MSAPCRPRCRFAGHRRCRAAGPGDGPAEDAGPGHDRGARRTAVRTSLVATLVGLFLLAPAGAASADPLWWQAVTNPNSICSPSDPVPETAGTGLSGLVDPPGAQPPATHYNNYEMAGLTWHATDLGCSDYLAIVGNYAANFVFMTAKAVDRVTITAYQTAYSPGLLDSLSDAVTGLVTSLRDTFYLPYVTPVVLLGAIWLAWQGLIRRRATTSVEGVVWMIIAVTLALWFLNRPGDILRAGNGVVNSANCAITKGVAQIDPNTSGRCFAENESGPPAVAQTSNSLWTVLVYRPWLAGEFGHAAATTPEEANTASSSLARKYGGFGSGGLLWTQAVTHKDLDRIRGGGDYNAEAAADVINRKHDRWTAIKEDIKNNHPSVYPLFQGRQWGARLGIAFAAFIAAVFAGGLILLVSVALIVLKLGFLLLIMMGPFFLLAGIHPGIGRVISLRWAELLVSTLLKQIVVALALAVLLFGYSVITTESRLSWGLQILLLSLMGIAAFIYRKPFQHLFASVGGSGFSGRVVSQSAGTNEELAAAHRRLASAPAGPPAIRRIGGRLATTALGGAVAGAVGGKVGAAVGAASTGQRTDGQRAAGAGAQTDALSADEAAGVAADEQRTGREQRLSGLRSGPGAAAPPPLDLSSSRSGHAGPGAGGEPADPGSGQAPARTSGEPPDNEANGSGRLPVTGPVGRARPARGPWSGGGNGHQRPAAGNPASSRSGVPADSSGDEGTGGAESNGNAWWQGPPRRPRPERSPGSSPAGGGAQSASAGGGGPAQNPQSSRRRLRTSESDGDGAPRSRRGEPAPPLPFWLRRDRQDEDDQ